jgi:hypothetical protein
VRMDFNSMSVYIRIRSKRRTLYGDGAVD